VIDPGTATLRFLVVEVVGDRATVWGWHERPGGLTVADLAGACREALARAEEMAQDLAGRWLLPDQMLVGLPAAQLRGGAWPVAQRRPRGDRPVEEQELEALLSRALRLAVNRLLGPEDSDWFLVDAATVALTVEGRGVTDPVGFRGREVGATVFAALAQAETMAAWYTVAETLEYSSLTLTAAPLALAAGLSEPQGIAFDVGGSTTDLTWWQNGRPVALASLPCGGDDLTRALLRTWRLSPDRAERLKRAYSAGRLDEEAGTQLIAALGPSLEIWLEEAEAALASMDQDQPLPQRLCILGGGSVPPVMAETVGALAWSPQLRFARYPQVRRLQPTDVPGVINRTDRGRQPGDATALALAAWTVRQCRVQARPERILTAAYQQVDR
jgi:hypothetical protein